MVLTKMKYCTLQTPDTDDADRCEFGCRVGNVKCVQSFVIEPEFSTLMRFIHKLKGGGSEMHP